MHHHFADLSGRVQRWRAAPHALPALIRDHHAGTPADRDEPQQQPEDPSRNDSAGAAFLAVLMGGESEQPDAEQDVPMTHAEQRLLVMACLIFGMATLLMVVSVYFITTTTPEQIGAWAERVAQGFRGVQ